MPYLILGIKALVRDGFRCIVTGLYDYRLQAQNTEVKQEVTDSSVATAFTECVYIFPQSIAMIPSVESTDVMEFAISIWTITAYLGFEDLPEKLVGNGIHTLENVMTLEASFHIFFETLEIWFEVIVSGLGILTPRTKGLQDDQANTYTIRARDNAMLRSCRDNPVTLTSQHPDLPLPSPAFLAIRAACCRVANLSGATEYIEEMLDNMEDIGVLAKGSLSTLVP